MPFDLLPFPRAKAATSVPTPFTLELVSVDTSSNALFVNSSDFDCGCPCNTMVPPNFITSSKMIADTVYLLQNTGFGPTSGPNPTTAKAVQVSSPGYLFKGVLPPEDYNITDSNVVNNGLNTDPTVPIYGMDIPLILSTWLDLSTPTSLQTLKIWLTCCYSSGETTLDGQANFDSCKTALPSSAQASVATDWPYATPQVAFISAGLYWPQNLAVKKLVNKGTPEQPFFDRRTIEAHVPIGEVGSDGTVKVQYLSNNLVLADICLNGAPVKYPMAMFNNQMILPSTYTNPAPN